MGATLKDIEMSQQGADKLKDTPTHFGSITTEPPKAEKQYAIFRLVKKKRGRLHIDGICDSVPNPKRNDKRERIWLLNGADSIWQSDLVELLKDKEYISRNRRSLLFEGGVCRIPVHDELALEFARANTKNVGKRRNGSGKYDYYEYDAQEEQKERLKKQMLKIDMVIKAKEMPVEPMRKLSSFFGIAFVDELGQPKGDDGVRAELMLRADTDPITFEKYIEARIDLTGQKGNAVWAGGKGFIAKIPESRKAVEYLTELAMTNSDEGRAFLNHLSEKP
jgi:hypothetical protein